MRVEVGGCEEDNASKALVTLSPKLYYKCNSLGWLGLPLDSARLALAVPRYWAIALWHRAAIVFVLLAVCQTTTSGAEVSDFCTQCKTLSIFCLPVLQWLVAVWLSLCHVCLGCIVPIVATIGCTWSQSLPLPSSCWHGACFLVVFCDGWPICLAWAVPIALVSAWRIFQLWKDLLVPCLGLYNWALLVVLTPDGVLRPDWFLFQSLLLLDSWGSCISTLFVCALGIARGGCCLWGLRYMTNIVPTYLWTCLPMGNIVWIYLMSVGLCLWRCLRAWPCAFQSTRWNTSLLVQLLFLWKYSW